MNFKNWLHNQEKQYLEGNTRTAGKTLLYPLGYGGIGLYPTAWYMPYSADAVYYISNDERFSKNGDGPPFDIRHLPGHKQFKNPNNGDGPPHDISELPGKVNYKKYFTAKDGSPSSIKHLPEK